MFNTSIIFNAGSYGTFIEWCINYFSNPEFPQEYPFNENGNSHKFCGNHLLNINGVKEYVNNPNSDKNLIVRFHPKTYENESIIENLEYIESRFKNIIFIYSNFDTLLWNINNKFSKVWDEGWLEHNHLEILENLKKWNNAIHPSKMQTWEKREFLSLYIYKQHLSEVELELLIEIIPKYNNLLFVDITDLRDNFKETLIKILDYCKLNIINFDKIDEVYNKWIEKQYHKNKDELIKKIVYSILNNIDMNWGNENLTIIDESFIQMELRNNGYEIKCFNLNEFPTSTKDLKPLLYAIS